ADLMARCRKDRGLFDHLVLKLFRVGADHDRAAGRCDQRRGQVRARLTRSRGCLNGEHGSVRQRRQDAMRHLQLAGARIAQQRLYRLCSWPLVPLDGHVCLSLKKWVTCSGDVFIGINWVGYEAHLAYQCPQDGGHFRWSTLQLLDAVRNQLPRRADVDERGVRVFGAASEQRGGKVVETERTWWLTP